MKIKQSISQFNFSHYISPHGLKSIATCAHFKQLYRCSRSEKNTLNQSNRKITAFIETLNSVEESYTQAL